MIDAEGIFHFCNSGGTSRDEIARAILQMVQAEGISIRCRAIESVPSSTFPTRAIRPHYSLLNTQKISRFPGKTPRSWQEAFKEYLRHVHST
jgi:dTDP-4-dehydrorhamnose reductase